MEIVLELQSNLRVWIQRFALERLLLGRFKIIIWKWEPISINQTQNGTNVNTACDAFHLFRSEPHPTVLHFGMISELSAQSVTDLLLIVRIMHKFFFLHHCCWVAHEVGDFMLNGIWPLGNKKILVVRNDHYMPLPIILHVFLETYLTPKDNWNNASNCECFNTNWYLNGWHLSVAPARGVNVLRIWFKPSC